MKILVINVALRPKSKVKLVPIGLAYVMTAIKNAGYDFELLDIDRHRYPEEYIENYLQDNKFDVVCLGCIVTGYQHVKWLTGVIRQAHPETTIILGNTVASSIPHIIFGKTHVDVVVFGEGEETIVELLDRLRGSRDLSDIKGIQYRDPDGRIRKNVFRPPIEPLDDLPFPDWQLFGNVEDYIQSSSLNFVSEPFPIPHEEIRAFPISVSRGCMFHCTFCYHAFADYPFRYRSPQSIVDEIKWLKKEYNINYVFFHDDLTFFSTRQARETIDCFLRNDLDIYWVANCRSGLFASEEDVGLASDFKTAGCVGLSYSLESSDSDILKMMKKKATPRQFATQVEILSKAGLQTWTSVVIGYPSETEETIKDTLMFCADLGVYPSVGYLLPQPGTPMYDYAIDNGYIKDEEDYLIAMGDRQDLHVNMTQLSDQQLQDTVLKTLEICNEKLHLALDKSQLIKTGFYKAAKKSGI